MGVNRPIHVDMDRQAPPQGKKIVYPGLSLPHLDLQASFKSGLNLVMLTLIKLHADQNIAMTLIMN